MTRLRINGAVWETGPRWPDRPGGAVGIAGRTLLVVGAIAGLALGLATTGSPVEAARGEAPAAAIATKDAARLGAPAAGPTPAGPFAPVAHGEPAAFATGDAAGALRDARAFAPPVAAGWQESDFTNVSVADGRTLVAGALHIRLDRLELPGADEACRTVDGRREACRTRAATLLELNTRWRTVSCRYRLTSATQAVGDCRIGGSDLGQRMARTGLLRRADEAPRTVAGAETTRPH